jgi:hypothetical protein
MQLSLSDDDFDQDPGWIQTLQQLKNQLKVIVCAAVAMICAVRQERPGRHSCIV